jgi:hypothetical protein
LCHEIGGGSSNGAFFATSYPHCHKLHALSDHVLQKEDSILPFRQTPQREPMADTDSSVPKPPMQAQFSVQLYIVNSPFQKPGMCWCSMTDNQSSSEVAARSGKVT